MEMMKGSERDLSGTEKRRRRREHETECNWLEDQEVRGGERRGKKKERKHYKIV